MSEGRVELFYQNKWGTICDDYFELKDAHVVCHQLGYKKALRYGTAATMTYGKGTGPIHLDDLNCTGSETILQDCNFPGWQTHNCGHGEDAGVVCDTTSFECKQRTNIPKESSKSSLKNNLTCNVASLLAKYIYN